MGREKGWDTPRQLPSCRNGEEVQDTASSGLGVLARSGKAGQGGAGCWAPHAGGGERAARARAPLCVRIGGWTCFRDPKEVTGDLQEGARGGPSALLCVRGGPMSLVRGWREVSPVRRQQIIVVVEFISPSSLCFCSRVTCRVLTSGHPHHSPAFSSRPRAVSCPGVPSSHTLQGSPVWGGLTSGYPSRLSSSAAPHSLGTRVGLCTIPFLSCIPGFAVPRVPASVPNPPPAT